ncbi:MAG: DUF1934 domain-containing protein [Clostridia bacterium]|nr:DUF1934 domain-containing protein [Clostridia bacterium]
MYTLKIESKTDSGSNVVTVEASGEIAGGLLSLKYNFDGAEYALKITEGSIVHERRGDVSLKMEFATDKQTQCTLEDATGKGAFEIRTEKLEVKFAGNSCEAVCVYSDDGGESKTTLTVTAKPLKA